MPDVGVLSLQIQDNSAAAITGLDNLVKALERVRDAVGQVSGITAVANGIKRIAAAVNENVNESTITKLGQLADELGKLRDVGNVHIKLDAVGEVRKTMDTVRNGTEEVGKLGEASGAAVKESLSGFDDYKAEVHEVSEEILKMHEVIRNMTNDRAVRVEGVAKEAKENIESIDYSKVNMNDFMGDAVTNLMERYRMAGTAMDEFKDKVSASIPVLREYKDTVLGLDGSHRSIAEFSRTAAEKLLEAVRPIKESANPNEGKMAIFSSLEEAAKALGITVEETQGKVNSLLQSLGINSPMTVFSSIEEAAKAMGITVGEARKQMDELTRSLGVTPQIQQLTEEERAAKRVADALEYLKQRYMDMSRSNLFGAQMRGDYGENAQNAAIMSAAERTGMTLDSMRESMRAWDAEMRDVSGAHGVESAVHSMTGSFNSGGEATTRLTGNLRSLDGELRQKKTDLKGAADGAEEMKKSFSELMFGCEGLKGAFKRMFPTISGLAHRFKSLLVYRGLRTMMRQIAEGFKTGYENFKQYSAAIGSGFTDDLSEANAQLMTMKNSIGAAIAPAIQAALPILQTLTSWAITAFNAVNQLLSLLQGKSTWSKAVDVTADSLDNVKKSAGGAGSAVKDLLASWDELNIIQSESGGGGGGGGAASDIDYTNMFTEMQEFDGWAKDVVEFLRKNFEDIKSIALDIGLAILGWKLSDAFGGVLGVLGNLLMLGAVVDITLRLTDMFGKEYVKTGQPGWFIADALTGALGATLAGMIATRIAGGQFGLITAGFTLVLKGNVDLKNSLTAAAQEEYARSQMMRILGSVEEGIAAALIMKGFAASNPMALAVGAAVAVFTYTINTLAAVNITGIKWGTQSLTETEIKNFVQSKMFAIDIESQIKITKAAIDLSAEEKKKLEEQATALLVPLHSLTLGVDIDGSLAQIKEDVFGEGGLIAQFKSFTSSQQSLIGTAETYVPTLDANGVDISGEITEAGNSAWAELNGLMDAMGADLSYHLTRAMDTTLSEELRKFELKAVEEITDTMIRVTLAGKRATASSDALSDLAFDLANADETTFKGILAAYEEYREQLTEQNTELKKQEASSFASAAAMYSEYAADILRRGGDVTDERYIYYTGKAREFAERYQEIMSNLAESVDASVDEAVAPGKELVRNAILELMQGAKELRDGEREFFTGGKIKGLPEKALGGIKENTLTAMQNIVTSAQGETNAAKETLFQEWMYAIIQDYFPDDYEFIRNAIEDEFIGFEDIFDPEVFFETMRAQGKNPSQYRLLWDMFFGDKSEIQKASAETKEAIEEAFSTDEAVENLDNLRTAIELTRKELVQNPDTEQFGKNLVGIVSGSLAEATAKIRKAIAPDYDSFLKWYSYDMQKIASTAKTIESSVPVALVGAADAYSAFNRQQPNIGISAESQYSGTTLKYSDNIDMKEDVQEGTAQGFNNVAALLSTANTLLTALLNKQFVATMAPTAGVGRGVQTALNAYANMTGNG